MPLPSSCVSFLNVGPRSPGEPATDRLPSREIQVVPSAASPQPPVERAPEGRVLVPGRVSRGCNSRRHTLPCRGTRDSVRPLRPAGLVSGGRVRQRVLPRPPRVDRPRNSP